MARGLCCSPRNLAWHYYSSILLLVQVSLVLISSPPFPRIFCQAYRISRLTRSSSHRQSVGLRRNGGLPATRFRTSDRTSSHLTIMFLRETSDKLGGVPCRWGATYSVKSRPLKLRSLSRSGECSHGHILRFATFLNSHCRSSTKALFHLQIPSSR